MAHDHSLEDALVEDPSGSELTSLLLEVMRRRSASVNSNEVLNRLAADRFTQTSAASPAAIRRVHTALSAELPPGATELELAPLVPFGTHHAIARVDQNRVVSTIRGSEVAADPTVVLAMEAAIRRKALLAVDPQDSRLMTLAGFQRVTRAQRFEGPRSFAHFAISGVVTAGRDTGSEEFERQALDIHVDHIVKGMRRLGCELVEVLLSDLTGGRLGRVVDPLIDRWSGAPDVSIVAFPDRTRARSYYTDLAIEIHVVMSGERIEVGDGGMTDWTQRLVASRKERLMISGIGVERLALAIEPP